MQQAQSVSAKSFICEALHCALSPAPVLVPASSMLAICSAVHDIDRMRLNSSFRAPRAERKGGERLVISSDMARCAGMVFSRRGWDASSVAAPDQSNDRSAVLRSRLVVRAVS